MPKPVWPTPHRHVVMYLCCVDCPSSNQLGDCSHDLTWGTLDTFIFWHLVCRHCIGQMIIPTGLCLISQSTQHLFHILGILPAMPSDTTKVFLVYHGLQNWASNCDSNSRPYSDCRLRGTPNISINSSNNTSAASIAVWFVGQRVSAYIRDSDLLWSRDGVLFDLIRLKTKIKDE